MSDAPATAAGPQIDASSLFVLAFIALFAYLDWITHRSMVETVLLGGLAAGGFLYRRTIVERLGIQEQVAGMSRVWRTVLAALPGFLYFMVRGQGTSGAGGTVLVGLVIVVGASAVFGPALDAKLAGFYAARNRWLPRALRMVLAIVAPVLVAFIVIHGSLSDLPALFGGTTNHPMSPVGREDRFLLGTLLSAVAAWLLLRDPPVGAAARSAPAPIAAPAAGRATFQPTHAVPAGGLDAWKEPAAGAPVAHLDPGVPLEVAERRGDWARVTAANGWSGWVDGRRLPEAGS